MDGAENYTISMTNPNAGAGLPGCACGSWRCKPPFIVFPTRLNSGARPGYVSVSASCVKKAVKTIEAGGEMGQVGNARPGEDGPPAVHDEVEGSTNPYHQTGVDPHARPLHIIAMEKEQDDLAARLAARSRA
jgi:hypothetical protein